ncbi:MAG: ATP-binding protein [Candidatus Symbiothrix sp.]|nr:ATP-binding protein [Candidatus Symbiothrix sp.]
MASQVRKMPIGIQDFSELRTGNFMYVDKTMYLHKLVTGVKQYFLGRPRRFGKSLFLTTLKYYFLGKKELFDGLYISNVEKNWTQHPVFHIEFVGESYTSFDRLVQTLEANLSNLEREWGTDDFEKTPGARFRGLIRRAAEKSGQKVVVLVDEYDKPLLETMHDEELNTQIRNELKGFYGVLKGADADLKFVFLTGVTKFSKVSIFSDLNHLNDISMDNQYSGICGISESELLNQFQPEIQELADNLKVSYDEAVAELKKNYDGYHFSKQSEDMYNPFSVLNTFDKKDIANYWFATGTPTFLVKMLQNVDFELPELEGDILVTADEMYDYRADNMNPVPVLYQSGYLTIKDYNLRKNFYTLGFPNEEVRYGFLNGILSVYSKNAVERGHFSLLKMDAALEKGNVDLVMQMLQAFYASIPYDLQEKKHKNERYFQSLFYTIFSLAGQFVETEVKSAKGRADAIVKTADAIFVFEFKMDENATAEDALKQIDDKGYLIPYQTDERKVVKIGAEFNQDKCELTRWVIV